MSRFEQYCECKHSLRNHKIFEDDQKQPCLLCRCSAFIMEREKKSSDLV